MTPMLSNCIHVLVHYLYRIELQNLLEWSLLKKLRLDEYLSLHCIILYNLTNLVLNDHEHFENDINGNVRYR